MKMTPDVIVSWPRNCDYPLWRQYIHDERAQFAEVIVVFTETNQGEDYRNFVTDAMAQDEVTFLQSPPVLGGEDWRNISVNHALAASQSAWVLFTEQDFIIKNPKYFWNKINEEALRYGVVRDGVQPEYKDAVGFVDGQRLHPAFLLVPREEIERTKKNFGIVPNRLDHFALFSRDLIYNGVTILELDGHLHLEEGESWQHLNGLSHNHTLMEMGQEITYHPIEFRNYLWQSLGVTVGLHPLWRKKVSDYVQSTN